MQAQHVAKKQVEQIREEQETRIQSVETKIGNLADAICTKQDGSNLLSEALSKQSTEFRQLMAKRSPEPSPMHDARGTDSKAQKLS